VATDADADEAGTVAEEEAATEGAGAEELATADDDAGPEEAEAEAEGEDTTDEAGPEELAAADEEAPLPSH